MQRAERGAFLTATSFCAMVLLLFGWLASMP